MFASCGQVVACCLAADTDSVASCPWIGARQRPVLWDGRCMEDERGPGPGQATIGTAEMSVNGMAEAWVL